MRVMEERLTAMESALKVYQAQAEEAAAKPKGQNLLAGHDISGQVVLITGATAG
jgi:hypothetical protein